MPPDVPSFPALLRPGHIASSRRCLTAGCDLSAYAEYRRNRLGITYYCFGSIDLLCAMEEIPDSNKEAWREWIWEQQQTKSETGSGFRTGTFMTPATPEQTEAEQTPSYANYDSPHIIMTYVALLILAMLRDDFSRLDRRGIVKFLGSCQRPDGSFTTVPRDAEQDLRTLYCAFAICSLLDDWSGIDVERALTFVESCRTYEGGYGQSSFCEGHGGITYIALASIYLAPPEYSKHHLTPAQKAETTRWLLNLQHESGGFCGRTNKEADACYCFWSSAALKILGAGNLFDSTRMAEYLASCQFKFGGIAKVPGETSDPYHTYLSLAALALYPPDLDESDANAATWKLDPLDVLINARESTAAWARQYIPGPRS
ncbi:geranylgeranyltransferase type I [Ephemerocybe angulata]|uniref:Geranylgeranyltransferase type I n=1 Tax=Ephemerocybe angulata TaxID=980116 RepID=A0A8H6I1S7_9AGAR|nr:geranylgeranyltransferase type I [Tulosesus angulatus]